jgi:hypothetical protein
MRMLYWPLRSPLRASKRLPGKAVRSASGVERKKIIPDQSSNRFFLELLAQFPERFSIRIHGYVLMGNHYHLQLETLGANLSSAMQWLNLTYGGWFNQDIGESVPCSKVDLSPPCTIRAQQL